MLDLDPFSIMDFGGYRSDPRAHGRMPIPSTIPVTTITTGIPLSDRFKLIQHDQDHDRVYSQDGYGIPSTSRYGGGRQGMGLFGPGVPKSTSQRNRQLALALAKRARGPTAPTPLFRNRGVGRLNNPRPVQSRLGIARGNARPAPVVSRGVRRGLLRNLTGGRGLGLNRVQKSVGAINRNRNQGQGVQTANRGQRGGRGSPNRGGARGRGRGGRGATRGGGAGAAGGAATAKTGPVSKESLDSELDSYMANSKAYLDKQLDDYMLQAKAAAAAVTAGTVLVEEADVSMADA
ncbi:unnamed protein product [Allacma fusca]|uniref:Chromatin target of PRMT1 protein C-terminal domain-containing protein n=1 Tax=Allacma fusca TaxID=39272 RepID=A0A8J2Q2Z2_9HEXA|nr:unnamed protein product [Allacma fusca]